MFKDKKSWLGIFMFSAAIGYASFSFAGGAAQCEGNTGDGCRSEGMVQGHFLPAQGGMAFSDDGLAYKPFFGPALSTRIRLQEDERASIRGASFGQWRWGWESYVSTVDAEVVNAGRQKAKVFGRDGGFRIHRTPGGAPCDFAGDLSCQFEFDAESDARLMKPGRVPAAPLEWAGTEFSWPAAQAFLTSLPLADRNRAFIKYEGETLLVYGKIMVPNAARPNEYEAWLTAVVDHYGHAVQVEYETGPLLRVSRLIDAANLSVRVYYPDTEPLAGAPFADPSLTDELRNSWRTHLAGTAGEARTIMRRLVTSIADPFGNRVRYDYIDALTGLDLRQLHLSLGRDAAFDQTILQASKYWRLRTVTDAVDVRSSVDYDLCLADGDSGSIALVASLAELAQRERTRGAAGAASPNMHGCLMGVDPDTGEINSAIQQDRPIMLGAERRLMPLFRRVAKITTPYGTTEHYRIYRQTGTETLQGYLIKDAADGFHRYETLFGVPSEQTVNWITRFLAQEAMEGRRAAISGGKPEWVSGQYQAFWDFIANDASLQRELTYRNSFYWGPKATESLCLNDAMGRSLDLPARARCLASTAEEGRLPLLGAEITHYLHDQVAGQEEQVLSSLAMAKKKPLENWVYYAYPNQFSVHTFRGSNVAGNAPIGLAGLTVRMVETADGLQPQTTYVEYNARRKPEKIWDAQGRGRLLVYDRNQLDVRSSYPLVRQTNAVGQAVWAAPADAAPFFEMDYNARRQLTEIRSRGYRTTYAYEPISPYRLWSMSVPTVDTASGARQVRMSTTRYQWSARQIDPPAASNLPVRATEELVVIDPMNVRTTMRYAQGHLISSGTEGNVTSYDGLDAFGRPARMYVNGLLQASYTYFNLNLETITDAAGHVTYYQVDALGRTTMTQRSELSGGSLLPVGTKFMDYDASGGPRVYWHGGELVPEASWEYDVAGRPTSRTDQDGTTQRIYYQSNSGQLARLQDGMGVDHIFAYLTDGRLRRRTVNSPLSGIVRTVDVAYDPTFGRVSRIDDNGAITRYGYESDAYARAGDARDPYRLAEIAQSLLDGADRPSGAEVVTKIAGYDAAGRIESWRSNDNAGSGTSQFMKTKWDEYGRPFSQQTEVSEVSFEYERLPGATASTLAKGPQPGQYGALKKLHYDLDGTAGDEALQVFDYYGHENARAARSLKTQSYYLAGNIPGGDVIGGPTLGPDLFRTVDYDEKAQVKSVSGYRDGSERRYTYDGMGFLRGVRRFRSGTLEAGEAYDYDGKGNRRGVYDIDHRGAIATVARQSSGHGYGNRIFDYQERGLPRCSKLPHDALGRLVVDPASCGKGKAASYVWDAEGRLSKIVFDINNATELYYDAGAQLRRKIEIVDGRVDEDHTYIWLDGELKQVRDTATQRMEMSFNGDGYRAYEYDVAGNVVQAKNYLFLRDPQGSVIGLADQQGLLLEELEYDEWGNIKQHWRRDAAGTMQAIGNDVADTKQVPFLYAGYFWLKRANLGLTHYRAYHPVLGRWLSKDPIGEIGGGNLYAYVLNSPTNHTDHSGLIIDTVLDIGFIAYDVYRLLEDGECNREENLQALALDVVGALIPGLTGLGVASRIAKAMRAARVATVRSLTQSIHVVAVVRGLERCVAGTVAHVHEAATKLLPAGEHVRGLLTAAAGQGRPDRLVDASWAVSQHKEINITALEHIFDRHAWDSTYAKVSRFFPGTTGRDIMHWTEEALRRGKIIEKTNGGGLIGYKIDYDIGSDIGRAIGVNKHGAQTGVIRIGILDGIIRTVFPL